MLGVEAGQASHVEIDDLNEAIVIHVLPGLILGEEGEGELLVQARLTRADEHSQDKSTHCRPHLMDVDVAGKG